MPDLLSQAADLPSFRVVPPSSRLSPDEILSKSRLPDGTEMFQPGGFLVPAARQFSMIVNSATRVYSSRFDEAMRDNQINARAMRRDAFLLGLLEERILPTINRTWELEVDNDRDPDQMTVRDGLTRIVKSIPNFDAFKRAQLDAIWFGRAGCQWGYKRDSDNDYRWGIPGWDPIHGDSVQFTFDGVPAIMIDSSTVDWYVQNGATQGPNGDIRSTDRGGMALVLQRPYWRDRYAIHRHIFQKADYLEGELAGSVQGFGIRGQVYWHYIVRTDALTWMLAYMQAVGQMDLLVFNYPAGNAEAKANQEANAQKIIGKAAIACPRNPTGNWPAIEQIQMNSAGLKALHDLVADYFDRHIERLIVGQSMSSGADKGDGLGGTGRANFAKATKDELLIYDTNRLDNTLSTDLIAPLKRYNYSKAKFPVRFKSILPDLEADDKLERGLKLVSVNVPIKVDELRRSGGYSRPTEGDETIGNPMGALLGLPPGVPPELAAQLPPPMPPGAPPGMGGPPPTGPGDPGAAPGMPPGGQMPPGAGQGPPMPFGPTATLSGGSVGIANQGPVGFSRGTPTRYATPEEYPEHQQLLAAIHANPLEATAHHAHADWLAENGFEDESQFRRAMAEWISRGEDDAFNPTRTELGSFRRATMGTGLPFTHTINHRALPEWASDSVFRAAVPTIHGEEDESTPISPTYANFWWKSYPGMEESLRRAFHAGLKRQREQPQPNPTPASRYNEMAAGTSPAMGFPGGSNTYIPKFGKDRKQDEIKFTRYEKAEPKLSSTQVNLTGIAAIRVLNLAGQILDSDLAEKGRETTAHVTVRYGIHGDDPKPAAGIVSGFGPIKMRLGKVSVFPGGEGKDYDVLKVDVSSPDLVRLNKALGKLPNTQTFPYHPHATIAYVRKGRGQFYADLLEPVDTDFTADSVVFSDSNKTQTWLSVTAPSDTTGNTTPYSRERIPEYAVKKAVDSLLGELKSTAPPIPLEQPKPKSPVVRKEQIQIHYGRDGKPTGATKTVVEE